MEARIRITSPQMKGEVKVKVVGKPKLILVNGHWSRVAKVATDALSEITTFLGSTPISDISPSEGGKGYWQFFLGSNLNYFITQSWRYFEEEQYHMDPHYADGSSLFGIDQSGGDRKKKGYQYAIQHLSEITKGVGTEKFYIISHSEGCAFAAGIASALMAKGYQIGESIMLSADEGDEFSVEGNYPSYQIAGARIAQERTLPANSMNQPDFFSFGPIKLPNKLKTRNRLGKSAFLVQRNRLYLDPVVSAHQMTGVTRYGVYIYPNSTFSTVHGSTISVGIFSILNELKSAQLLKETQGSRVRYKIKGRKYHNWHKIDKYYIENKQVDIYEDDNKTTIYRR